MLIGYDTFFRPLASDGVRNISLYQIVFRFTPLIYVYPAKSGIQLGCTYMYRTEQGVRLSQ